VYALKNIENSLGLSCECVEEKESMLLLNTSTWFMACNGFGDDSRAVVRLDSQNQYFVLDLTRTNSSANGHIKTVDKDS